MIRQLDATANLSAWTHRAADDPGIALLEGAAILGDILTFYQDLYANEAFLRTARWRDSVSDLVRLLGYRLSPGLGGRATFAFEVKSTKGVTVPKGFSVKANVEGLEKEAEFETAADFVAYPWLGRFNLFRPLQQTGGVNTTKEFYIDSPGQDLDPIVLKPDDKILIGTPQPPANPNRLEDAEIVIIESVRQQHGTNIYKIKGSLRRTGNSTAIAAFKLGRSFHHFGYNAPQTFVDTSLPVKSKTTYTLSGSETTTTPNESPLSFERSLNGVTSSPSPATKSFAKSSGSGLMYFYSTPPALTYSAASTVKPAVTVVSPPIQADEIPLDVEVQDLPNGASFLMQLGSSVVIRKTESIATGAMKWGQQSGTTSTVKVDANLAFAGNNSADIRELVFYEVLTPRLTLKAAMTPAPQTSGSDLYFYGTDAEAQALTARSLIIADAEPLSVVVQSVDPLTPLDRPRLRRARLDTIVSYASFPHEAPFLDVFGNLVEATQGKTQAEAILGSGDNTQIFQTFKLPAPPLTYLLSVGTSPPETPELQIYVNNRLWNYAPTLFGRREDEEIYVVREDIDNNSYVQFGDGKTGVRLPTGFENVSAVFRTGTGAFGALKEGTKVQGGKLEGLDKIQMPDVSSGGSEPEEGDNAKAAAPAKVQSLDRLVGLQDFEFEVAAISGVARTRAAWQLRNNIPAVVITVLMETGRSGESDAVREVIGHYNQCRGPNRYPVIVEQGTRQYVRVDVDYAIDPSFREELVSQQIAFALGTNSGKTKGDDNAGGLFGAGNRTFGQAEYANTIVGIVQNVAGVKWAIVRVFNVLSPADDPATINVDASSAVFNESIAPGNGQILSLFSAHLTLNAVAEPVKGAC
jgi:predicted phage baseplate assembly protein